MTPEEAAAWSKLAGALTLSGLLLIAVVVLWRAHLSDTTYIRSHSVETLKVLGGLATLIDSIQRDSGVSRADIIAAIEHAKQAIVAHMDTRPRR